MSSSLFTRYSSVVKIEIVDQVPRLLGRLQLRDVSLTLATTNSKHSLTPNSFLPINSDIYFDSVSLVEGESRLLMLSLSSLSSTPSNGIHVVLLYDFEVTCEDWIRYVMSVSHPEIFFSNDDDKDSLNNQNNLNQVFVSSHETSETPFSFGDSTDLSSWSAIIKSSFTSTSIYRKVIPIHKTGRSLLFENVNLVNGETLQISINCLGIKGMTQCIA